MNIDFIALDFETACANRNSACSIGIVAVEDCHIVDSYYSLIKPPDLYFEDRNVRIHGITPQMVETAPTLDELWPEIRWMFTPHCLVVAHNAGFDMSVFRSSASVQIPNFPYVDSMAIAAPLVSGSKSLENCARELDIKLDNHHNALADAEASAKIAIRGIQSASCISMWEYLCKNPNIRINCFDKLTLQDELSDRGKRMQKFPPTVRLADVHRTVECIDGNHPLYGKRVVFTGELSISRKDAMQMAVNVGAIVKTSVSGKTDYLIVGKQDTSLVGDDGLSSKEERAYELIACGAQIKIIQETEFIELVSGGAVVS